MMSSETNRKNELSEPEIDRTTIVCILRECKRTGVLHFKYGDLEVHFQKIERKSSDQLAELPKTKEPFGEETFSPHQRNEETLIEMEPSRPLLTQADEELLKAFDEVQLAIDDPLAYEEAQMAEDVETQRVRGLSETTEYRRSE
jgi:hypothetical protein